MLGENAWEGASRMTRNPRGRSEGRKRKKGETKVAEGIDKEFNFLSMKKTE